MLPLEQPLLALQLQKGSTPAIKYRSLQPGDYLAVKAAHDALFPIDYDSSFFHKATNGLDRIWSCAAFVQLPYCEEQLVGFITAKTVFLHECEVTDRQHLGLLSPLVDHDLVLYILTLGVVEGYRHQGIASALIQAVCQRACETRCRAVFLHVITYNAAAMNLYSMQGFTCVARLPSFYYIATGRQPDPNTVVYDAYLYVQYVGGAALAGVATPWDMLALAWSPLRSALGRIHACMPGFCRQQQQQLFQHPSSPASPGSSTSVIAAETSRSSSNSVASSYQPQPGTQQTQYQQQQQQQQQPPVPQLGAPKISRQRLSRRGGPDSTGRNAGDSATQARQQQQQQQLSLLPSAARHGLQQQQQQQQRLYQQQQREHAQQALLGYPHHRQPWHVGSDDAHDQLGQQQQQQRRPQRMLWWLFNGQSREGTMRHQGQQQQQQQQQYASNSNSGC